jgi:predicted RNA-binding protein
VKNGIEELLLEGVELIENTGGRVEIRSLYGEQKTVRARVKSLSLVEHRIVLEPETE